MASESGIDERDLKSSMLQRLEPRMVYKEGWVFIVNYPKYLIGDGPKFWAGVRNAFKELPEKIQALAKDSGYPMDSLSIPYSGFSNRIEENRIDNTRVASAPILIAPEREEKPEKEPKDPLIEKAARLWYHLCKEEVGIEPSGGLAKHMAIIKRVRKSLSHEQIRQMMDEWFQTQTLEDHEMIQITRCFSTFQVDKFRAENV